MEEGFAASRALKKTTKEYKKSVEPGPSDDHRQPGPGSTKAEAKLSVVIVLRDSKSICPVQQLFSDYKREVEKTGLHHEFIFVIDGDCPPLLEELDQLKEKEECIKIIVFNKVFGEATALSAGFEHASGSMLLTLPAYHQIDPQAIPFFINALAGSDMAIVRRWPRADGLLDRLQTFVFNYIVRMLGFNFNDLTCKVRIFSRKVIETVHIYGDQHRFFPVLASHYGFKVKEVEIPQSEKDASRSNFRPGTYIRRLLDLLSIFFLVKFTKKPLRFFGLTGLLVFGLGTAFSLYLAIERIYMGVALADRPVLLLGLLLIVLGMQLFAIGLIGELIIFIHARNIKEYTVEKIIGAAKTTRRSGRPVGGSTGDEKIFLP